MKSTFGKKQILLAVMVVALGVAVYLNYYFSVQSPPVTDADATTSTYGNLGEAQYVNADTTTIAADQETETTEGDPNDYFVQARQNRETARQEALDVIKDLMNDVKANDDTQKQALDQASAIAAAIEQESKIESLIKAKGFSDCVVYIENDKCNIVVRSEDLKPAEALQITEIVTNQSNIAAKNVNIQTVK